MDWIKGKTIGHGSFATVSLAKSTNRSSNYPSLIAVKSCAVSHSESLINERMVLDELKDCPEIISCFGDSITVENGVKLYNVALEYASGGALSEKLKKSGGFRLSENEIRRYTKSILNGLEFVHGNGFVHCDIKPQNVLLFSDGVVKIADFGLAKKSTESRNLTSKYEIRGTPMYMAPETVIRGEQESASDIWALGCLVTEMITGDSIWNCTDLSALLMRIGVGTEIPEIPKKLSDAGKDFLEKCFLKDPKTRWTAEMLLRHPFVNTGLCAKAENQISPRDPFDFPNWESESQQSCCLTPEVKFGCWEGKDKGMKYEASVIPAVTRLGQLMTTQNQKPNWSVSNSWVKVR
ncbi:hypothetical protein QVD17_24876 [Tagetes erecta]|uniref:Protein kinase domain-containing protein n=1 Tax=Tagetes erecta TaxID=13708 RepID=A0AAD8KG35_TARER|nr:hypothetical protein QVD17_24876 [Tagetes erecta]